MNQAAGITYTVRDIASRYGVHETTVLDWINKTGELKAVNIGRAPGKKKPRWRITPEALEDFENLRPSKPQPAPRRTRRKKNEPVKFYE